MTERETAELLKTLADNYTNHTITDPAGTVTDPEGSDRLCPAEDDRSRKRKGTGDRLRDLPI